MRTHTRREERQIANQEGAEQRRREAHMRATTRPGVAEIYVDLPQRKVVGYMCNACRRAFLNGAYVGEQAAKGPANRCCWCESHQRLHKRPEECPECAREQEARQNEARWKREAELLARAMPAPPDMESFFVDDELYSDVNDYFDCHANRVYPDGVDPDWIPIVYEAEPAGPALQFDASTLIERANERAEVGDENPDCMLQPAPEAVAELQASLDAWLDKYGPKNEWFMAGRAVRLDAEFKHWLAENPDAVAKGIDENDEDETATQGAQE